MNFVGHARLARERHPSEAFVLGAVAPDLVRLAGLSPRVPLRSGLSAVNAGLAFHRATDVAFHRTEAFLVTAASFAATLRGRGVTRGPRRAVAHFGFELLLDGILLDEDPTLLDAVVAAVRMPDAARLVADPHREAWERTLASVATGELMRSYREPRLVVNRLSGMLSGRRRLTMTADDEAIVIDWIDSAAATVRSATDAVVRQTRSALDGG